MRPLIAALAAAVLLAACQTTPPEPLQATAQLKPTKGNKTFGEATFEQAGDKVYVVVFVQGLKPGAEHGLHIHEVGDCSSGDGMSAKGHFNPFGKPHGHPDSAERHAGDLAAPEGEQGGPRQRPGRYGHHHLDSPGRRASSAAASSFTPTPTTTRPSRPETPARASPAA